MESAKDVGKNVEVNEYQRALNDVKNAKILLHIHDDIVDELNVFNEEDIRIEILQELVDKVPYYEQLEAKATPMKPVGEKYYELCPLCYNPSVRSDYASNYELKRCHECGQAIDWSKDE